MLASRFNNRIRLISSLRLALALSVLMFTSNPDCNCFNPVCQVGALLISYRAKFLRDLGQAATGYHRAFTGGREILALQYRTVSTVQDPFAPIARLSRTCWPTRRATKRRSLESAQCLTGPHRGRLRRAAGGA